MYLNDGNLINNAMKGVVKLKVDFLDKRKGDLLAIFICFLSFALFFSSSVYALSPIYGCGEGQVYYFYSSTCVSPEDVGEGISPPGFIEGFVDKIKLAISNDEQKAKLSAEVTAEKVAAFEKAIKEGDYSEAKQQAEKIRRGLTPSGKYIEDFGGGVINYEEFKRGEGKYNDFYQMKGMWTETLGRVEEMKREVLLRAEKGEISQKDANEIIEIMSAKSSESSVVIALDRKENAIIEDMIKNSEGGVTRLEVELEIARDNKASGLEGYYKVPSENFAQSKFDLDTFINQIKESKNLDFTDIKDYVYDAKLILQNAENSAARGDYADAYALYHEGDYLIDTIGNYAKEGDSALEDVNEEIVRESKELNLEIESENKALVEDYESMKEKGVLNEILENNPEEALQLEIQYTRAQEVTSLSNKIGEIYDGLYERLASEGKSDEEAREEIEDMKKQSYYYTEGGKYFPPGYVDIEKGKDNEFNYEYGGGFPKGIDIPDEISKVSFRFGTDGYSWVDPLSGVKYTNTHPADYNPAPIIHGDEVFRVEEKSDDGLYKYEYSAFGYRVVGPDGEEKKIAYGDIAPSVQIVGGALVSYSPVGCDFTYRGETTRWAGNPQYGNMIDVASGKVFVPEVSHIQDAVYDPAKNVYEYSVGEQEWKFDPQSKIFSGGGTEIITTLSEAPIGREDEKVVVTGEGTEWSYNSDESVWEKENLDGSADKFIPSPNNYYSYEETHDGYIDSSGELVEEAFYDGKKWEQEGEKWVSEKGDIYDPKTGETFIEGGLSEEDYGSFYGSRGDLIKENVVIGGYFVWDPASRTNIWLSSEGIPGYDSTNPSKYDLLLPDGSKQIWVQEKDGRWKIEGASGKEGYYGYETYIRDYSIPNQAIGSTYTVSEREGGGVYVKTEDGWRSPDGTIVGTPPGYGPSEYEYRGGYYNSYYQPGTYSVERAAVGKTIVYEGKTYTVTAEKGWTDENGNAVSPPPGQPSSSVGGAYGNYNYGYYMAGDYGYGAEKSYNYVEEGKTYYFPPGVDPAKIQNKEVYRVENTYGYDSAVVPGSTGTYGTIKDPTTGQYRPATKEEQDAAIASANPNYSPPVPVPQYTSPPPRTGVAIGTTVVQEGKTYTVTDGKGWTDENGKVVPTPPGQEDYYVGGGYTGGYTTSPGTYTGGTYGGYAGGGYTGGTYGGGSLYAEGGGSYGIGGYGGYGGYGGGYYGGGYGGGYYGGGYTGGYTTSPGTYTGGTYGSGTYAEGTGGIPGTYTGGYTTSPGTYTDGGYTGGTYKGYGGGSYGGGYYGGSYGSGSYGGSTYGYGGYTGGTYGSGSVYAEGGGYTSPGTYTGGTYGGYTSPGTYTAGTYTGGTYGGYTSPGTYTAGTYTGGTYGGYTSPGTYTAGTYTGGTYTDGGYTGGTYGGYTSPGTYTGGTYTDGGTYTGGTYTGGSTTGGTYTGGSTTTGGTYTGGTTGETTTGGTTTGGSSTTTTTTGGDSGGSTTGGSTTTGGDSGGSTTTGTTTGTASVIKEFDKEEGLINSIKNWFKKLRK
ncbi:MAG: hypothetical protein AABW65_00445 [Nanoarchaeota archaeon]|mgnify:FL=1